MTEVKNFRNLRKHNHNHIMKAPALQIKFKISFTFRMKTDFIICHLVCSTKLHKNMFNINH